MPSDFKMEVSKMAVLWQNYSISVCCKEIGIAIDKASEFTMWDKSVQDSYQELSGQTLSNPTTSSLLSPPYSRLV